MEFHERYDGNSVTISLAHRRRFAQDDMHCFSTNILSDEEAILLWGWIRLIIIIIIIIIIIKY